MRRHAEIDQLAHLEPHDHVAWWGWGADDLCSVAVAAWDDSRRHHERLLVVSEAAALRRLERLPELEDAVGQGDLELLSLSDVYERPDTLEPATQLAAFTATLESSLGDGYAGLRVVADNTAFASADDAAFASWLAWEQVADRFEAERPVVGICYFDARAVGPDRIGDLAALHPIVPAGGGSPPFRVFFDGDTLRVVGALEIFSVDRIRRLLAARPSDRPTVLDLSRTEFVDHRALLTLNDAARTGETIRVRGARTVVRRLWDVLEVAHRNLVFEERGAGR